MIATLYTFANYTMRNHLDKADQALYEGDSASHADHSETAHRAMLRMRDYGQTMAQANRNRATLRAIASKR